MNFFYFADQNLGTGFTSNLNYRAKLKLPKTWYKDNYLKLIKIID